MSYLAVFIGGGLGSVVRLMLGKILSGQSQTFPFATFIANLSASFILGLTVGLMLSRSNETYKYLIAIGFCGGFSTFSTFSLETVTLLQRGEVWVALSNIFISVIACMGAVWLGISIIK